MAGSYRHLIHDDGTFAGVELLDHLGDAYEALEECYLMIQQLSGGDPERIARAWMEGYLAPRRTDLDAVQRELMIRQYANDLRSRR